MEATKLLKSIIELNDYTRISQDVSINYKNLKIQFNMSTVLALKKIKSLEIEYFNKCDENGAAIKIFELILNIPASKTWGLLGKELICLLQYWLDGIRKHLIVHHCHWWSFLRKLLKFIQEIRLKDGRINNVILEETAECLLDLGTHQKPDLIQRHEIVSLFNICGADSSREIRFTLRKQLDCYFIKLSSLLGTCGDVPIQFSILETLLRWLLPRQDKQVRLESATRWFPGDQFTKRTVELFLERPWHDFFQDARDFINAHNSSSDFVTSVVCKSLRVDGVTVILESRRTEWLDLNLNTGRMTAILDPKALECLGTEYNGYGTLVLVEADVDEVKMYSGEETTIHISVVTSRSLSILPSLVELVLKAKTSFHFTIGSGTDMATLDKALRAVFPAKYQVQMDAFDAIVMPSGSNLHTSRQDENTDKISFSNNVDSKKRRHVGYVVKPKYSSGLVSPSTASTSSLAQLHDKLAALPRYDYEKEPISVCARPQLSSVAELSEDDRLSTEPIKRRPYGVCNKSAFSKTSDSSKSKTKCISPADLEDSVSCLMVATIGSADESVINDTLERFPQVKDGAENILDLLVLEAFQNTKKVSQSKTEDKIVVETETLAEETSKDHIPDTVKTKSKKTCTVVSSSCTEDSCGVVEGTQVSNVIVDRRVKDKPLPWKRAAPTINTFDEKAVEEFFSQHFAENRHGGVVISPTLAKKINETSSESSEFDECERQEGLEAIEPIEPDLEVVECVNFVLDRICNEFSSRELEKLLNVAAIEDVRSASPKANPESAVKEKTQKSVSKKPAKGIKLKFNKNATTRSTRQNNKLELIKTKDTISEETHEMNAKEQNINSPVDVDIEIDSKMQTPNVRRKRKLYSPKDEKCDARCVDNNKDVTNIKCYVKPINYYKQVEEERSEYMKKLRNRKLRNKAMALSPKTKKLNDTFDNLKNKIEDNNCVFVDKTNTQDIEVYNFTSDSEDEDFKRDKIKRKSTNNRQNTSSENKKKPQTKRKRVARTKTSSKIEELKLTTDNLVDERMREANIDILNTTIEAPNTPEAKLTETIVPIITVDHKMEAIEEAEIPKKAKVERKRAKRPNKAETQLNQKKAVTPVLNETIDRTESPLPGLLVEATVPHDSTVNDSVSAHMLKKFKDIFERKLEYNESERYSTRNLIDSLNSSKALTVGPNVSNDCPNTSNSSTSKRTKSLKRQRKNKVSNEEKHTEIDRTSSFNKCEGSMKFIDRNNTLGDNKDRSPLGTMNISCGYSEKSFDTVGHTPITAHGDFELCENDVPPSRQSLKRNVEPRNLEVDDLNQSIKEFFTELNKEIAERTYDARSKIKRSSNNTSNSDSDENTAQEIANIRKKSRNRKITSSSNSINDEILNEVKDVANMQPVATLKSPIVSVTRLSSGDIHKWLKSRPNSEVASTVSVELKNLEKTNTRQETSPKKSGETRQTNTCISPIRLFDDLKPFTRQDSAKSKLKERETKINSSGSLKCETNLFYKKAPIASLKETNYWEVSSRSNTDVSRTSKSVKTQKSKKRREESFPSQIRMESAHSVSSVNDWLDRIAPVASQEAASDNFKDNISSIMETLDTTLVEIHHNTSRRMAKMFAEAQGKLQQLRCDRKALYKNSATSLVSGVLKLVDQHFTELDERSREMDEKFMADLKESARNLIHDDCTQKKAMVRLLREDAQAVLDYIDKGKGSRMQ